MTACDYATWKMIQHALNYQTWMHTVNIMIMGERNVWKYCSKLINFLCLHSPWSITWRLSAPSCLAISMFGLNFLLVAFTHHHLLCSPIYFYMAGHLLILARQKIKIVMISAIWYQFTTYVCLLFPLICDSFLLNCCLPL